MSKEERRTLRSLQKDDSIIILRADKGNKTVVMDRSEYDKKILDLLDDQHTYRSLIRTGEKRV